MASVALLLLVSGCDELTSPYDRPEYGEARARHFNACLEQALRFAQVTPHTLSMEEASIEGVSDILDECDSIAHGLANAEVNSLYQ